jgi:threonine synthase
VAVAAARAVEFGVEALACASTGNLAGATAAAAAALGIPAYVFIPADLETAKVEHALAYGATVVPIQGTYDDVNRLCLEVADETGWGFVNINLRPFYAEGSKTLAYEIASRSGGGRPTWSSGRSRRVPCSPASRAGSSSSARLIEDRPIRFVGGQAAAARSRPRGLPAPRSSSIRTPDTIVRSLAIGNPADGSYAVALAMRPWVDRGDRRRGHRSRHPRRRPSRGDLPGDGRRRDLAAAAAARRRGIIRPGDEVVALLTGNGLRRPMLARSDSVTALRDPDSLVSPSRVRPSLSAFESWLGGEA